MGACQRHRLITSELQRVHGCGQMEHSQAFTQQYAQPSVVTAGLRQPQKDGCGRMAVPAAFMLGMQQYFAGGQVARSQRCCSKAKGRPFLEPR